jgi:hypothetical protein
LNLRPLGYETARGRLRCFTLSQGEVSSCWVPFPRLDDVFPVPRHPAGIRVGNFPVADGTKAPWLTSPTCARCHRSFLPVA